MHNSNRYRPAAIAAAIYCLTVPLGATAQSESASTDAEVAGRVKAALAADSHLLARHIDVKVKNGVVHLGGFVESREDLKRALDDARAVPGVGSVANEMELKGGQERGTGS